MTDSKGRIAIWISVAVNIIAILALALSIGQYGERWNFAYEYANANRDMPIKLKYLEDTVCGLKALPLQVSQNQSQLVYIATMLAEIKKDVKEIQRDALNKRGD